MPEDELNFEEAVAAVNKTLVKPQLPSKIREIIEDKRCEQLNPEVMQPFGDERQSYTSSHRPQSSGSWLEHSETSFKIMTIFCP